MCTIRSSSCNMLNVFIKTKLYGCFWSCNKFWNGMRFGHESYTSTNISELIVSNIWFYKFSSASGGYVFDMSFPLQRAFLWNRPRIKTNITQNTASKVSYPKIFWSAFSHIWIKYRDLQSKFLYSVQIREIRTWKTPNTHTFHSVKPWKSCCRAFCKVLNLGAFDMLLDQQPYDLIVRQESNLFELRYIRKCLV